MDQIVTDKYAAYNGDCVELIKTLPDQSVGFSIWSPPFPEVFLYSDDKADFSNSRTYNEFVDHFGYLLPDLFRVIQDGRNVAIHCMDLPINKGKHGYIGIRDFPGMIIQAMISVGFIYHSRVTLWKDPVTEMQRTKALGLLHKQVKKDSAMSRQGLPDYILAFRKPGESKNPIKNDIDVNTWQKYASPVWMDINYTRTLNGREGRSDDDIKHICPLQLDTIERCVKLWSNKGDTVLTCFGGIGSEGYQSILMERLPILFELKPSYFQVMKRNLAAAVAKQEFTAPSLLDMLHAQ